MAEIHVVFANNVFTASVTTLVAVVAVAVAGIWTVAWAKCVTRLFSQHRIPVVYKTVTLTSGVVVRVKIC